MRAGFKARETDLTQGVIWKQLLLFAVPFLLSNLLQQLYSTVDAVIVGQAIGTNALAALGGCLLITACMIEFFVGISAGASISAAQAFGRKDEEGLSRVVHTTVAFSFITGIGMIFLGNLLSPVLLRFMATPEAVFGDALLYMRIFCIGMFPVIVYNMGSGILRALGDSRSGLYFLAASCILNIILDLLFVCLFSWGIAGAAWATVIAQLLPACLVLRRLTHLEGDYRLQASKVRIHGKELWEIIRIGLPAGIRVILVNIAIMVVQSKINSFGISAMAGSTVCYKLDGYVYTMVNAVALAVTNFEGQNMGARDYLRVKEGKRIGLIMTTVITFITAYPLLFFGQYFGRIFTDDAEVIRYAVMQMHVLYPIYFLFSWNEIISSTVMASGNTLIPMLNNLVGMCFSRVAFILVGLTFIRDVRIVYLGFPFSWIITHIGIQLYYHRGKWMDGMCVREAVERQKNGLLS